MTRLAATHELRTPTGLDEDGRVVVLRTLGEAGVSATRLIELLMRDGPYSGVKDYLHAVEEVHGTKAGFHIVEAMKAAASGRENILAIDWESDSARAAEVGHPIGLLLSMPTADFLTVTELGIRAARDPNARAGALASEINRVCERRGIPYRLTNTLPAEFEWIGDAEIQQNVLAPALSVLDDPRLREGPKKEYDEARRELRNNTPESRKQAATASCNAVESSMEVLCEERDVTVPSPANAQPLFKTLLAAGFVTRENEEMILGPSRFGNRRGRHGGGRVVQEVSEAEAEQVVGAAAVAILYLGRQLP